MTKGNRRQRARRASRSFIGLGAAMAVLVLLAAACQPAEVSQEPTDQDSDQVADAAEASDEEMTEEEEAEPEPEPATEGGRVSIRWATADVGSFGYAVASYMTDFLNRELPEGHIVTVHPYPSTTAAMKAVMEGEAEIGYTADVGMVEFYNRGGPFEGYEPATSELVHSFYAYPMESFLVTDESHSGSHSTYADFDGEPVFFTPAGFMNWLNFSRVFDALGYEFTHVEIDTGTVADALQGGTIVGAGAYTTAGSSLAPYWREAELRADLAPVQFTDEELASLEAAGLVPVPVDPSVAFTQDLGVDEVLGVPIRFGYNLSLDTDEEFVYQMLTIFEANLESLVALEQGFEPLAADFVGMQVGGIAAAPAIPVHPGLARFLQERDAWDDSWVIAE